MNVNRYTERTQEALVEAQTIAGRKHNTQVEQVHVLLALLDQDGGVATSILRRLEVDLPLLKAQVEVEVDRLPTVSGSNYQPTFSADMASILQSAMDKAEHMHDEYVSVEHLVLAMADSGNKRGAGPILRRSGVTEERVLQALSEIRGGQRVTSQNPEGTYEALARFGRDLTDLARKGKLDPVIGATRRFDAPYRYCRVAPKTIRCSLGSREWARPPSWKVSHSASSTRMCRRV
jgi:ATP-dependent Clp protease ATP-binding subunit ClpB